LSGVARVPPRFSILYFIPKTSVYSYEHIAHGVRFKWRMLFMSALSVNGLMKANGRVPTLEE